MKIFGHPMSTCTRKVLATLHEKGQTPDLVVVDFAKGEHKAPDHVARQPFGQLPALEDGAFKLFESRAIMRYIDEVAPGPKLTPQTAQGRATMEEWISVEHSNFSAPSMKIIMNAMFNPMMGRPVDQKAIEEGTVGLDRALDVMQKRLDASPFIAGETFSLADISYMPYLEYLATTPQVSHVNDRPAVAKWWKKISERPAWQKTIGKA
jgi:glutathione S-transferase